MRVFNDLLLMGSREESESPGGGGGKGGGWDGVHSRWDSPCLGHLLHQATPIPLCSPSVEGHQILSLPTESFKSKDLSLITRAINKWTTAHKSSRQACFHHINIFFLGVLFSLQIFKVTLDHVYNYKTIIFTKYFKKLPLGTLSFFVRNWPRRNFTLRQYGFVYNHRTRNPEGGGVLNHPFSINYLK